MTKEEYTHLKLHDGRAVSVLIKSYRILQGENATLSPEIQTVVPARQFLGEGI